MTGNTTRGIRNWAYDQNPTTFGDIGYDLVGPEVHADGEIWTATLWQLRKALVAKYGAANGLRRRRPPRHRRDAADRPRPVVPRRARRHPRRRPRPLPRRQLRHHLDRLRPPRRGRVGHVAGRRRHRPAPRVRPSDRRAQRHARRHGGRRRQRRTGRWRARDRGRLRGPRHPAGADVGDRRLLGEARLRQLRRHRPGARLRRPDVQGDRRGRGRDEAHDAQGGAEPRLARPTARRSCRRRARTPGCPPSSSSTTPRPACGHAVGGRRPTTTAPTSA